MNYEIIRSNRKTIGLIIERDGSVKVRAPYRVSQAEIQRFVESKKDWIRKHLNRLAQTETKEMLSEKELKELEQKALQVIPQRVSYYANVMGVTYGRITIRNQKTRWGSCSSKGNLNFNCQLMLMPDEIIDYVVVHELCHRKQMNHSKAFWDEVEKIMPDYKKRREYLKQCRLQ